MTARISKGIAPDNGFIILSKHLYPKKDNMSCRISVVMLSFNSVRYLPRSVPALVEALGDGDYEIWIVDNGSTDGSIEEIQALKCQYPNLIHPIFNKTNLGTTASRNQALSQVRGRYVLVLDSDIIAYDMNIINGLCRYIDSHPDVGLVVPKLVYATGNFQISTDVFPSPVRKFKRFIGLKSQESKAVVPNKATDVDYAISAFWFMPRQTLETIGLLDEKIFYAPEDVDYCIRVWKSGHRIVYHPGFTAVHDAQEIGRSVWKVKRWPFLLSHIKGLLYLFCKHRYISREMLLKSIKR
jgi:GT2 family glycosyltransferase